MNTKVNYSNKIVAIVGVVMFAVIISVMLLSNNYMDKESADRIMETIHKQSVVEGKFIDNDENVIFESKQPYHVDKERVPVSYSYLLGYNSVIYGSSELRNQCFDTLYDDMETGKGGTVQLTVRDSLQNGTYQILKEFDIDGSIVVLNNKTGEILACVSRRGEEYEVDLVGAYTDETQTTRKFDVYSNIESFFLPNATKDADPPGSVFKLITAIAAIEKGVDDYTYVDTGLYMADDMSIKNDGGAAYGNETLESAFMHSTNTYFSSLAVEKIGEEKMRDVAKRFLIGEDIELDFATLKSNIKFNGTAKLLASTAFGQGELVMTPMHIAMIGQTIANDGVMLKPYLIKSEMNAKGKIIRKGKTEKLDRVISSDVAEKVRAIANTNAKRYANLTMISPNLCVKSGTAEIDHGSTNHAYLLGFDDTFSICVSVNDTQAGGSDFAPFMERVLRMLY